MADTSGPGHGLAVDWWSLGIVIHIIIYSTVSLYFNIYFYLHVRYTTCVALLLRQYNSYNDYAEWLSLKKKTNFESSPLRQSLCLSSEPIEKQFGTIDFLPAKYEGYKCTI